MPAWLASRSRCDLTYTHFSRGVASSVRYAHCFSFGAEVRLLQLGGVLSPRPITSGRLHLQRWFQ